VVVIEDACHALGAEYRTLGPRTRGRVEAAGTGGCAQPGRADTAVPGSGGRRPRGDWSKIGGCTYSDMTVFSFHPVKLITAGEGGAVLTNRRDLQEKLHVFRTHGIRRSEFVNQPDGDWYYEMDSLGFNYRITDIQAALGMSQLRKLDRFVSRRREIAERYRAAFAHHPRIAIPPERCYARSSYHLFPLRLSDAMKKQKHEVFSGLRDAGIGVQVHYIPVYLHPYYQEMGYKQGLCPAAEDFYQREMSIPVYPGMSDKSVDTVIRAVTKGLGKG